MFLLASNGKPKSLFQIIKCFYWLLFFLDDALSVGGRVFLFDHVFKENVSQEQVYNQAALPIVKVREGMKGTLELSI